jgi:serine/threonine protein phosphatase PrpC
LRVWLKNENLPGLAMTRSIGDLVAGSVGVTWKPEIAIYKMCQEDRIITIASDGIWEVLENIDVHILAYKLILFALIFSY